MLKSPFPGMDPFLERHWTGVHAKLITYISDQLQPRVGEDLRVRAEERVFLEDDVSESFAFPDVFVVEHARRPQRENSTGGVLMAASTVAEPRVVEFLEAPVHQRYLEILDITQNRRVVTVIELMSPSNKRGRSGHELYRQKQLQCQQGEVNLVEIDLTRWPGRCFLCPQEVVDRECPAEYQACVWRAMRPQAYSLYGFPLRQPIPAIAVPLRPGDRDAVLELQPLIEQVYETSRYDDIDYSQPIAPPLPPADLVWLEERMKLRGSPAPTPPARDS